MLPANQLQHLKHQCTENITASLKRRASARASVAHSRMKQTVHCLTQSCTVPDLQTWKERHHPLDHCCSHSYHSNAHHEGVSAQLARYHTAHLTSAGCLPKPLQPTNGRHMIDGRQSIPHTKQHKKNIPPAYFKSPPHTIDPACLPNPTQPHSDQTPTVPTLSDITAGTP
jgi:hypothetical protein